MYVGNVAIHDALARAAPGIIDTEPYVDDDYVDDDYTELAADIIPFAAFFDWNRSETVRACRWLRSKLWRRSAA